MKVFAVVKSTTGTLKLMTWQSQTEFDKSPMTNRVVLKATSKEFLNGDYLEPQPGLTIEQQKAETLLMKTRELYVKHYKPYKISSTQYRSAIA